MKKLMLLGFVICLLSITYVNAATINSRIIDAETKEAIPFASVYVPGTNIGTATDVNGRFSLSVGEDASVEIAMIGYEAKKMSVRDLIGLETIELTPVVYGLDEVVVTSCKSYLKLSDSSPLVNQLIDIQVDKNCLKNLNQGSLVISASNLIQEDGTRCESEISVNNNVVACKSLNKGIYDIILKYVKDGKETELDHLKISVEQGQLVLTARIFVPERENLNDYDFDIGKIQSFFKENDVIKVYSGTSVLFSSIGSSVVNTFGDIEEANNVKWYVVEPKDYTELFCPSQGLVSNEKRFDKLFHSNEYAEKYVVLQVGEDCEAIKVEINPRGIATETETEAPEKTGCETNSDCGVDEECQIGYGICKPKKIENWACSESDGFAFLNNGEANVLYNHPRLKSECVDKTQGKVSDSCADENNIIEYSCENYRCIAKTVPCSEGMSCVEGKCVFEGKKKNIFAEFSQEQLISAVSKGYNEVLVFGLDQSKKLKDKSPLVYFHLTPHGDYTHFNRVGTYQAGYEIGCENIECIKRQRDQTIAQNLVVDTDVSIPERTIVTIANLDGRSSEDKVIPVLKHFPGGPAELEITEGQIFTMNSESDGLDNMERGYLKPFKDSIKLQSKNDFAIMISHGIYPKLEEDLKSMYPNIATFVDTENTPASLNPFIVRGLLRDKYGFDGYIIADWYDMESIQQYIKSLKSKHPDLEKYSNSALTFILAVYAGIQYIPETRVLTSTDDLSNLQQLYDQNNDFKELLDDLVFTKMNLAAKFFGNEIIDRNELLNQITFRHKIEFLIGWYTVPKDLVATYPYAEKMGKTHYSDVWDRGNGIHNLFRRGVLSELYNNPNFLKERGNPGHPDNKKYLELNRKIQEADGWKDLAPIYDIVIQKKIGTLGETGMQEFPTCEVPGRLGKIVQTIEDITGIDLVDDGGCVEEKKNIFLCKPEANIPIPFCTISKEECISGIQDSFKNMNFCVTKMEELLIGKYFLYLPGKNFNPKCINEADLILKSLDDSGNMHKQKLIDFQIRTFLDEKKCDEEIQKNTYYLCHPESLDSEAYCSNKEETCKISYFKKVYGIDKCQNYKKFYDDNRAEFGEPLCESKNNIFYVPNKFFFGIDSCKEGHTQVNLIILNSIFEREEIKRILQILNEKQYVSCEEECWTIIPNKEKNFYYDLPLLVSENLIDSCTEKFDTYEECKNSMSERTIEFEYKLCYDLDKNKLYCKKFLKYCNNRGNFIYASENLFVKKEKCENFLEEHQKEFYIECVNHDDEYICTRNPKDCNKLLLGYVYENLEICSQKLKKEHSTRLYKDQKNIWRCGSIEECPEIKTQGLRYFNGLSSCEEEAKKLNGGGFYVYKDSAYENSKKIEYFNCEDSMRPFTDCSKNIEAVKSSIEECLEYATNLNSFLDPRIWWYLCDVEEKGYICTTKMGNCNYNRWFPIHSVYTYSEECETVAEKLNADMWYLCESDSSYNCQKGNFNCPKIIKVEGSYWQCQNEKEKIQPTIDSDTDIIFIPVNWRGSLADYEFYANSHYNYMLETAKISNVDLSPLSLKKIVLNEKCDVGYIMSLNIDTKVLDCLKDKTTVNFNPVKDKIIALTNDDMGRTLGFTSKNFPYLNIVKYEMKATLAHELGHSAFNLCDQYSFEEWNRQDSGGKCPNAYPECCFDNPKNKKKEGNNCYPETVPENEAQDSLCAGQICDPINEKYCRSVMGPGYGLKSIKELFENSLERKYPLEKESSLEDSTGEFSEQPATCPAPTRLGKITQAIEDFTGIDLVDDGGCVEGEVEFESEEYQIYSTDKYDALNSNEILLDATRVASIDKISINEYTIAWSFIRKTQEMFGKEAGDILVMLGSISKVSQITESKGWDLNEIISQIIIIYAIENDLTKDNKILLTKYDILDFLYKAEQIYGMDTSKISSTEIINYVCLEDRCFDKDEKEKKVEKILRKFIETQWNDMIENDLQEISDIAKATGVPAEAILSTILVEDIRTFSPDIKSMFSKSFMKAMIRKISPNKILVAFGHNPNPRRGHSSYGVIHHNTFEGAKIYLSSLDNLDEGAKEILSKENGFSDIEKVALVLKAHMEYWKREGYDIFEYNFDTINTFGERVGLLETLNVIFAYHPDELINIMDDTKIESGFHSARLEYAKEGTAYRGKREIPKSSPELGGTDLWGITNYGILAKVFVDSGLATDMLSGLTQTSSIEQSLTCEVPTTTLGKIAKTFGLGGYEDCPGEMSCQVNEQGDGICVW